MRNYYQFQSKIYDATRWSFLFGRNELLRKIPFSKPPEHIVEVGCGTGHNLKLLAKVFPGKQITGIDVSTDMLTIARRKVGSFSNIQLREEAYGNQPSNFSQAPDLVLFSYALTMINPQYSAIILQACEDLADGGRIAIVDFHSTPVKWFKQHMEKNHVRMEGHMDSLLKRSFQPLRFEVRKAYGGLWNYFFFVGGKKGS